LAYQKEESNESIEIGKVHYSQKKEKEILQIFVLLFRKKYIDLQLKKDFSKRDQKEVFGKSISLDSKQSSYMYNSHQNLENIFFSKSFQMKDAKRFFEKKNKIELKQENCKLSRNPKKEKSNRESQWENLKTSFQIFGFFIEKQVILLFQFF
jgi:hypothetical protein